MVENCQPEDAGSYRCQVRYIERYTESYIVLLMSRFQNSKFGRNIVRVSWLCNAAQSWQSCRGMWIVIGSTSRGQLTDLTCSMFSPARLLTLTKNSINNPPPDSAFLVVVTGATEARVSTSTALGVYGSRTMSFGLVAYPAFR